MLPIVDKPVIHYLVEEAVASGIEEIIIITGQNEIEIKNYFNRSSSLEEHLGRTGKYELLEMIRKISEMAKISYVTQEQPLGLGHAIYYARKFIEKDEMFSVLLGDDLVYSAKMLCLTQLIKIHEEYKANIIGVQYVPKELVGYYGIIKGENFTERLIKVEDLVEKPDIQEAPSTLAIMGRYVIHSNVFDILENAVPGKNGEIQLTDALRILNSTQELYAYRFEGTRFDVGDRLSYIKANMEFALNNDEIGKDFKKYLRTILDKDKL